MYKVSMAAGGLRGMSVKVANFQTKEEACGWMTVQLNNILNNPAVKKWDVSMQETCEIPVQTH